MRIKMDYFYTPLLTVMISSIVFIVDDTHDVLPNQIVNYH